LALFKFLFRIRPGPLNGIYYHPAITVCPDRKATFIMEVEKGDCFLIFLYGQDKERVDKEDFFLGKNNTDFNLLATDL